MSDEATKKANAFLRGYQADERDEDDDRDPGPESADQLFPWETPSVLMNAQIRRAAGRKA